MFFQVFWLAALSQTPHVSGEQDTDFVYVPEGNYAVGKKGHLLNPRRQVKIEGFLIAKTEVTNRQFNDFVTSTAFVTDAELHHDALVFEPGLKEFEWKEDSTACWRFPNGVSRGGIEEKMNHPVTCISYSDALAYCLWARVRLPTLDEWEIASRAGAKTDYFFGRDRGAIEGYANIWYGRDHLAGDTSDGYMYTSPVGSYKPNRWGLYDVYGNVFEFCSGHLNTTEKETIAHARGGSWWCSRYACNFFNSVDIGRVHIHASFSNQGFRAAKDLPEDAISEINRH